MKIITLTGKLLNCSAQVRHTSLRGGNRATIIALFVLTGLARVEPELQGTGEDAIGDIPEIGVFILVGDAVADMNRTCKGLIKMRVGIVHGVQAW